MRVVIYGHTGTVGAQLYRWLGETGADDIELAGVSLDRQDGDASEPDWAFLCLPTPTVDGQQDLSAIDAVCEQLGDRPCHVVIRSTVLPGTCARIQVEHPEWYVYHWPEFLSASTAWSDFCAPEVYVVGGDDFEWLAAGWEDILPNPSHWSVYTDLETAELIKYAHNCHGAMQVIFSNLLRDAVDKCGADWTHLMQGVLRQGYVSAETARAYWNVNKDGYRGYGGACFPKDVDAARGWLAGKAELLDGMAAANARLRGES
jgi:UDPglucose 6-dehydrogenase